MPPKELGADDLARLLVIATSSGASVSARGVGDPRTPPKPSAFSDEPSRAPRVRFCPRQLAHAIDRRGRAIEAHVVTSGCTAANEECSPPMTEAKSQALTDHELSERFRGPARTLGRAPGASLTSRGCARGSRELEQQSARPRPVERPRARRARAAREARRRARARALIDALDGALDDAEVLLELGRRGRTTRRRAARRSRSSRAAERELDGRRARSACSAASTTPRPRDRLDQRRAPAAPTPPTGPRC